jgi:hypothetical protein
MTERRRLPHKRASQNFSFECADHTVLTGTIVERARQDLPSGDEGLHLHLFHPRQSSEALMSDYEHEALHPQQQHLSLDDKPALNPQQRCDRCGTPFSPRWGSGGSRQRFCSSECRLGFHTQRQRMERRAAYIAPTTPPAGGQSTQNETPTREPAVAALHRWETGLLNIANCERTEFVVALNDARPPAPTSRPGRRRCGRSWTNM